MPHSEELTNGDGSKPARRGVYLLTHPRSASNLFQTMMVKQRSYGVDVQSSSYYFFDASFSMFMQMGRGSLESQGWTEADRAALYEPYKAAFERLNADLANAEQQGQQVFIKEHACLLKGPDELFAAAFDKAISGKKPFVLRHADSTKEPIHTNPTYLPDDLLLSMQPVFQIRHPVLMFPSFLRTEQKALPDTSIRDPMFPAFLTLRPSRTLFDWYANHSVALTPRVIDADDIMNDKEAVRQLCLDIDFDPDAVQYEWDTRKENDPMKAPFLSTIYSSKGIKPGLEARCLDIETEKAKWIAEFGEQDGEILARYVYDAMPDYEYLLEQRVRGSR